jgi:hypothetical protein
MSEAKVGLSATVWVEVAGLFMVVLDFVNEFGFVPLHVLKSAMRINVSINMPFGIAACYSRESAPAMPISSGATRTTDGIIRTARRRAGGKYTSVAMALPTCHSYLEMHTEAGSYEWHVTDGRHAYLSFGPTDHKRQVYKFVFDTPSTATGYLAEDVRTYTFNFDKP